MFQIVKNLEQLGVDIVWYKLNQDEMPDIDILQVFSSEPCLRPIILKAKRRKIPIVVTPMIGSRAMSNSSLKSIHLLSSIPGLFSPHKERYRLIKDADHLLALSAFEKKRLQRVYQVNDDSITIVENGIDDQFISIDTDCSNKPKGDYFITVGRIEPNKNQYNLIQAVNKLGKDLYIVGEPGIWSADYMDKCKAISNSKIHYLGAIRNVGQLKQLYARAIATVIPSFSEMVPLTVFESLSVKTPVVVTRYSSLMGTSIQGLFFSGTSTMSIISGLKKAVAFDCSKINKDGIYSWRDIAEKYLVVYKNCCNNK